MGLQIRVKSSRLHKLLFTSIAIFAIAVQPMYGLMAGRTANAAAPGEVKNITTSETFATIQAAISDSDTVNGNVIEVGAGTYNESVTINKSVTLRGAQAGVDARPSAGSVRDASSSSETVVSALKSQKVFTIAADGVTINGFVVKQAGGSGDSDAIKASSSQSNITIVNTIVVDATDEAIQLEAGVNYNVSQNHILNPVGDGITFSTYSPFKGTNLAITNNEITGSTSAVGSIYLYGAQNVEVSGNLINTRSTGIALGTITEPVRNIVVRNNTVNTELYTAYSSLATAVGLDGNSSNVTIERNKLQQVGAVADSREVAYPDRFNLIRVGVAPAANPANVIIKHNDFSRITQQNYLYIGSSVTNTVAASENWWGAQANPASKITSPSAAVVSSPWLCQSFTSGSTTSVAGSCVPVDSTPPTFSITNLSNGQLVGTANTNKLVIEGTLTDPSGARALIQLVKPGVGVVANNVTVHAPVVNGTLAEFNTAGLASGAYELHIRPTDYKGNAIPFYVINFNLDTVFPTFAITGPANNRKVSGTITINAEVKDANNITKLLMNVGGKSLSWTPASNGTNITRNGDTFSAVIDTKTLPDGPVHVTLRGTDGAGNTRYWNNNATHRQHVFYVDNTGPVATLLSSTLTPLTTDVVTITGSVADDDIKSHWFEITTPTGKYYEYNMNTTSKTFSFPLNTAAGAGVYKIRYVATDRLGNRNDTTTPAVLVLNVAAPIIPTPPTPTLPSVTPPTPPATQTPTGQTPGARQSVGDGASLASTSGSSNTAIDNTAGDEEAGTVAGARALASNDNAEIASSEEGGVLGDSIEEEAAPGWLASNWYWILGVIAAGAGLWFIAGLRRRRNEEA